MAVSNKQLHFQKQQILIFLMSFSLVSLLFLLDFFFAYINFSWSIQRSPLLAGIVFVCLPFSHGFMWWEKTVKRRAVCGGTQKKVKVNRRNKCVKGFVRNCFWTNGKFVIATFLTVDLLDVRLHMSHACPYDRHQFKRLLFEYTSHSPFVFVCFDAINTHRPLFLNGCVHNETQLIVPIIGDSMLVCKNC